MLSVGDVVGERWVLERQIGVGGLSHVWLVRHVELGSVQALKMLSVKRPRLGERLLREGRIQAQLQHPHIVPVRDVVRHDGYVGLLMDYIDGVPLDVYLDNQGALDVDVALALFAPVLSAVAVAHDAGVLHRDIKPANILLARTSQGYVPKVADFGIAKLIEDDDGGGHTRSGAVLGTPGYLAPEQATDASTVDERADVFALGVVVYEMLCGQRAYEGELLDASLATPPLRLDARVSEVSTTIANAVHTAIDPAPGARFLSVRAFGEALFADHPTLVAQISAPAAAIPLDGTEVFAPRRSISHGATPSPLAPAAPTTAFTRAEAGPAPWMIPVAIALLATSAGLFGLLWQFPTDTDPSPITTTTTEAAPTAPVVVQSEPAIEETPAIAEAPAAEPVPEVEAPAEPADAPAATTPPAKASPAAIKAPVPSPQPEPAAVEAVAEPDETPEPAEAPPNNDGVTAVESIKINPDVRPIEPVEEPEPEPVVYPKVEGLWRGDAAGRPLRLRITSQSGRTIAATVTFVLGPTERSYRVSGTLSPEGKLQLRDAENVLTLSANVDGEAMNGTYNSGGPRPQPFTAQWASR